MPLDLGSTQSQYSPLILVEIWRGGHLLNGMPDLLSITTNRQMGQLAGSFALTFKARGQRAFWRELDGDELVVIRGARPHIQKAYPPSRWPVLMVGQLNNVSEPLQIGGDRPQWVVVANGQDGGGWIEEAMVHYYYEMFNLARPGSPGPGGFLPTVGLSIAYGISTEEAPANDFAIQIMTHIVNGTLLKDRQTHNPKIPLMSTDASIPGKFQINGLVLQPMSGSAANLLDAINARPFTEMFISDSSESTGGGIASQLTYRFAPLTDESGAVISPYAQRAPRLGVRQADILSSQLTKSRNEVFTWYFVHPSYAGYDKVSAAAELKLDGQNPIVDDGLRTRFGYKFFDVEVPFITIPQGIPAQAQPDALTFAQGLSAELCQWAHAAYKDNWKLRSGQIQTVFLPHAGIGSYYVNTDTRREGYIESVGHTVDVVSGVARTTLGITRERALTPGNA